MKRCELSWRQKQRLWFRKEMWTTMKTEAAVLMPRQDVNYREDRSSGFDARTRYELPWRQKQRLWFRKEMWTTMKTEAAVLMPRQDVNYRKDRSSGFDAKTRCELPWRQKQRLWFQEQMWTTIKKEAATLIPRRDVNYHEDGDHTLFWNANNYLLVEMATYPIRQRIPYGNISHMATHPIWQLCGEFSSINILNYFPRSTDLGISHMCAVTAAPLDHWW